MQIIISKNLKSKLLEVINDCSSKRYNIQDIEQLEFSKFNVLVYMSDTTRFELQPNVIWDLEYDGTI